jgi:predicted dehydrogenase
MNPISTSASAAMEPIVSTSNMPPPAPDGQPISRRQFVRGAAGATLAAAAFPAIIPASALGRDGKVAPSNRIVLGVIGCGPQGMGDTGNFLNQPDCQVAAVCDVNAVRLEQALNTVNGHYKNQDCRAFHDFRELVARPDIDACLVTTPDHWHVLAALAAVNNGKDVYVEKPLGLSLAEDQALRAAIYHKKRVFQFGTQQRSERAFRFACELACNGALGTLKHINVWAPGGAPGGSLKQKPPPAGLDYDFWLGPAPVTPYTENRCLIETSNMTWYFISDYAVGFIAGWGIHPMDIALWGGGELARGVVTAEGRGNFPFAEGVCDTATIWEVNFAFGSGLTMTFVGLPNGHNQGEPTGEPALHADEWKQRYRRIELHGTAFEGSNGWAKVDRSNLELQPDNLIDIDEATFKTQLTHSPNHVRNFLDCIKSRAQTVCPIEAAIAADTICHITNIAVRLRRKITFDFRREQFVNDPEANRMLNVRAMRKPWHL